MQTSSNLHYKLILLFCVWRAFLLNWAFAADYFFKYSPTFPYAREILPHFSSERAYFSWANFDGIHYLTIATTGYQSTALIQAFFPLYPLLVRFGTVLFGNPLVAGLLISHAAALLAVFVFLKLLQKRAALSVQLRTLALLFLFPTSFFFGSLYTESLFLLLILTAFWCADRKYWLFATLAAMLATATRIVGIALIPALIIAYCEQKKWRLTLSDLPYLALLATGSLGLLAYMLYLQQNFGDPLLFLHVQSGFGSGRTEHLVLFPQTVWRGIKIVLYSDINWRWWTSLQELFYSLVFFTSIVYGFFKQKKLKIPLSWLVFSLLCFLIPPSTGTLSSMPRYVLILFPVFFIWAQTRLTTAKWLLIFSIFIVGLVLNTLLFIQGYWVA